MFASLPLTLIIAWSAFVGFVHTHQRHARYFKGSSSGFLLSLHLSVILGTIVGLALLVLYFLHVVWYLPIILIIIGIIVSGIGFAILDALIGAFWVSMVSFVGWPLAALWFIVIVRHLSS